MALRSVVLRSPEAAAAPAARATKVVRAGPPDKKGRAADWAAAILGALLLILTIVLVQVLPHHDPVLPQFRVTYSEAQGEGFDASQVHNFTAGSAENFYDFPAEIVSDNVQSIAIRVAFTDDFPASTPDRFQIELRNPNGERIEPKKVIENAPPRLNETSPFQIEAQTAEATYSFPVNPKPQDEVVRGVREDVTKDQVSDEVARRVHVDTAGTWTVKVTILDAGGCPAPNADGDPQLQILCQLEVVQNGGDQDAGNDFAVEQFTYTYYAPVVEQL